MFPTPIHQLRQVPICLFLLVHQAIAQFTSLPRWGQAVVVVNDALFVHGGKTDQFNQYSYTSALTNNDLLLLDLSSSFDPSSPPWQYVGGSLNSSSNPNDPALAWHTLAAYNSSQVLLFGGDGGPNSPIVVPDQPDSAWILDIYDRLNPNWISEPQSWAGEPNRRIHHAVASTGGKIWIVGGEKDDGSGLGYSDHSMFDPAGPAFTSLPTGGPPDIYGHASLVLSNGWLIVLGGYSQSESQLIPFTTIWVMDTTQSNLSWSTVSVSGDSLPPPRRAFAAVVVNGNQILIHGGADAELQTSYSDGWILDTTANPMTWSNISALTSLGPRRDHFAVQVGSQVVFGFGYGINSGASANLFIYDIDSGSFSSSYTPETTPSQTTLPAPSGTYADGQTPTNSNGSPIQTGSGTGTGTGTGTRTGSGVGTQTGTGSNPGQTGVNPTSTNGSDPNNPNVSDDTSKKSATAIALGTLFGVLALVAVIAGAYVYYRRRQGGSPGPGHFRPLIGNEDMESPVSVGAGEFGQGENVRMAGSGWFADGQNRNGWTFWGLGTGRRGGRGGVYGNTAKGRFDILADEDARDFDIRTARSIRRDGSGSSGSWFSVHSVHERSGSSGKRPTLGDVIHGSLTSLRSVGAMLSSNVGIGSASSRRAAAGNLNPPEWWEKTDLPLDPFSDQGALYRDEVEPVGETPMALGGVGGVGAGLAARPRGGKTDSSQDSIPYADPFRDQEAEVLYDANSDGEHEGSQDVHSPTDRQSTSLYTSSNNSIPRSVALAPLITVSSRNSLSDPATSSSSHDPPPSLFSAKNSLRGSSYSSHDALPSPSGTGLARSPSGRPRTTSIVGAGGGPTQPMKRSDSWWTRFRRTSFRDLNPEGAKSPTRAAFDIRDPNPAPRLTAIQESANSSANSPDSPESRAAKKGSAKPRTGEDGVYVSGGHDRSMSSLRTQKTADSEAIEKMGRRMDVVQRDETMSSHQTTPSTASSLPEQPDSTWYNAGRPLSAIMSSSDRSEVTVDGQGSSGVFEMASPLPMDDDTSEATSIESSQKSTTTSQPTTPARLRPVVTRKLTGGAVASRVAAYERRMSQDIDTLASPKSPTGESRAAEQGKKTPQRKSGIAVNYGLAPRPELFVANPDHTARQSSDP